MAYCKSHSFALIALTVFTASAAMGDSFASPRPRIFSSEWGFFGFKVLEPIFGKASKGVLFTLDPNGNENTIWTKPLINVPNRVFVTENGKRVITIDTYGRPGFEHSMVVYDQAGQVLADYALEDLLSRDEISARIRPTVSTRNWTTNATYAFSAETNQFVVTLNWPRVIKLNLETGKLE